MFTKLTKNNALHLLIKTLKNNLCMIFIATAMTQASAQTFPEWQEGFNYNHSDIVSYGNNWYAAIEAHTSHHGYFLMPTKAPSLWKQVLPPPDLTKNLVYATNDLVYFSRQIYKARRTQFYFVSQKFTPELLPYDWLLITPPSQKNEQGVSFTRNQIITFNGKQYKARISHISYDGRNWYPPNKPALWSEIASLTTQNGAPATNTTIQQTTSNALVTPTANQISCGPASFETPFDKNSPWNLLPINPQLSAIGIPKDIYFPAIETGIYSTGVFEAKVSDNAMTILPLNGESGVWNPDARVQLEKVIIKSWPQNVIPATGSDGHAEIIDVARGIVHSFWKLKQDENGTWRAKQWSTTTLTGTGWGDGAQAIAGVRSAGTPATGGLIRKHEINDGLSTYQHALAMSLSKSGLSATNTYDYPATSQDTGASSTNQGQIPLGALMMLPASFDVESLSSPELKKIARTLQTYGARVVDRNGGTPFVIYVELNSGWNGRTVQGWDNAYAASLEKIRTALRQTENVQTWKNKCSEFYDLDSAQNKTRLLSMRGPWRLVSGSVLGIYNSETQSVEWGETTSRNIQRNTVLTGLNQVNWAKPKIGFNYKLSATSQNGAKCKLEIRRTDNFELMYQSAELNNGEHEIFKWPNATYAIPFTISGENYKNSSAKCNLEQI